MSDEERLDVICQAFQALYDNWQEGGTFGRLVERLGFQGKGLGAWERVQCSGALTLHNALAADDEAAFQRLGRHAQDLRDALDWLRLAAGAIVLTATPAFGEDAAYRMSALGFQLRDVWDALAAATHLLRGEGGVRP